ncbi:MAG TPA: septation protein A [Terriglobia bacterium]|nr:septation protein A [Terriglobia bacterium]
MRQTLKYAVDYGPILAFFIAYKMAGLMAATLTLMIATALATLLLYIMQRRLAIMPIITMLVVGTFGGLTLWLHDDTFIKMKPTVIQGLFALILFGGLILKKPLIRYIMGSTLQMDDDGWRSLSLRFACFFAAMAVLNEIVWRTQPESIWIDFKVFGIIGLTLLFILTQIPLILRHSTEQQS